MASQPYAVALALAATLAQAPAPKPSFEVATIKRNVSQGQNGSMNVDPGERFRAVNAPVLWMMSFAYATGPAALRPEQIVNAPDWLDSEHYDIVAKGPGAPPVKDASPFNDRMRLMLQSLLEERLKLRMHREKREMPVYVLVRANAAGTLGPRLKQSTPDCFKGTVRCGFAGGPSGVIKTGAITMDLLTQLLANSAGRIVIDRTELTGGYDIDLEYSPDQRATDQPSVFTAVQEQLGLKLDAAREPVDVVVVDHIERPVED